MYNSIVLPYFAILIQRVYKNLLLRIKFHTIGLLSSFNRESVITFLVCEVIVKESVISASVKYFYCLGSF